MQWHTLDSKTVLAQLHSTPTGISSDEATERLSANGANRLPHEKGRVWYQVVFEQINSPLVYVLLAAAIVSLLLNERIDAFVIAIAVCVQVVVGLVQEYKAQTTLQSLQKVISLSAQVWRDGKLQIVSAEDLVPGDVIRVQAGDKVPADGRLLEVHDLEVNEAALTGESEATIKQVRKIDTANVGVGDQTNMVFTGTVVMKGNAVVVITATASATALGRIATLITQTEEALTPLQTQLGVFARHVTIIVVILAFAIFSIGYLVNGDIVRMFTVAVAVSVSAIPEGLAVAVTVILAVGMQRILRRKGLVRKLVAAETLGSVDVICTDKTGTLTEGKMVVTDFITWDNNFVADHNNRFAEAAERELWQALRLCLLCNDATVTNPDDDINNWVISGNLTERALFLAATQAGLHYTQVNKEAPRLDTIPFDSATKYMATLHREAHGRILYVKGAPELIAAQSTHVLVGGKAELFTTERQSQFNHKFLALSKRGLRILALAYKVAPDDAKVVEDAGVDNLTFIGYVGIKDPLRAAAKQTIALCQSAGIKTVMITGDHKLTAQAIAQELNLPSSPKNIAEGGELDSWTQHELKQRVSDIAVYARVTPEHKIRIVQAWQAIGKVVAMTGDGINDAPAIKAADIGIALGSGTDVAKDTADMVILDDDFSTLVAGVEEGRGIFDNIRKTVLYLVSDSFSEVIIIIGSLAMGIPIPLLATQILWVNLVNDSFPSLAMTQEPKEPAGMSEPPRGRSASILDREVKFMTAAISLLSGGLNLVVYYYFYKTSGDVDLARTAVFFSVGMDSLFILFSVRSLRTMIYQTNPFRNKWIVWSFVLGTVCMLVPIYVPMVGLYMHTVPLSWFAVAVVLAVCFIQVISLEVIKFIYISLKKRS